MRCDRQLVEQGWFGTGGQFGVQVGQRTPETERENDESLMKSLKQGNKSFIIKGRGSSVVEQPIRNRNLPQRKQTEPTYT